ncbi:MAG: Ku protein [Burkholderiaceae bacterium]|nr:Ku protein [Burkholderiaceae bacterium]
MATKKIAGGIAPTSTRTLWKGAITFGLVHIPVGLHSATQESGLDFDWIDRRSGDRVGYKRINKATGKEIATSDIVKGIEYEDGQYVILTPEELEAAYPKTLQTIEIEAFVKAGEIPFVYLEKPYYVAPINRGSRVYALLRETLKASGRVGLAKVVISSSQHLAVLIPCGPALILNLLRWGDEVRSWEQLSLPDEGREGLKPGELKMAQQLVDEMTTKWDPNKFRDSFREQVMELVEKKAQSGKLMAVTEPEKGEAPPAGATVHDLSEMLRRSLASGKRTPAAKTAARGRSSEGDADDDLPLRKAATKKPVAKKVATKKAAGGKGAPASGARPAAKKTAARTPARRKAA